MTPAELLTCGKIKKEDYDVFVLFEQSEMGKKFLDRMVRATYMEYPTPGMANSEVFAFMDGRRSVFRGIMSAIEHIYQLMNEENHD